MQAYHVHRVVALSLHAATSYSVNVTSSGRGRHLSMSNAGQGGCMACMGWHGMAGHDMTMRPNGGVLGQIINVGRDISNVTVAAAVTVTLTDCIAWLEIDVIAAGRPGARQCSPRSLAVYFLPRLIYCLTGSPVGS